MKPCLLGCIADDFTGATDLANNLVRGGMRVVQTIGVPDQSDVGWPPTDADAIVVALKSRTAPVRVAVEQSLAAARALLAQGAKQLYFKVCSTFDSTPAGNIGPVAEALMALTEAPIVPVTPAFPAAGRTVFKGHLFVGNDLLSDSSMRHHPLTPMSDACLPRVLQQQCRSAVGLVEHADVRQGPQGVRARLDALRGEGVRFAIVDAISNDDMLSMGRAFSDLPLLVAGSGVAIGLPQNHGIEPGIGAARLPVVHGARAIVSGSCSAASNAQVVDFIGRGGCAFAVDPLRIAAGADVVGQALAWAASRLGEAPILLYATAKPDAVKAVQSQLGVGHAGELIEAALSMIALGLVERGVRQLIVAGGETSGACVQALQVAQMRIGPQIDPGVPWCHARSAVAGKEGLLLALKSGNFGSVDFFSKAFAMLA
jgi:3-dehydrotetronate 4-kinase